MQLLFKLFLTFAKIGLFTFGGGYAMIPIIENACVEQKGWITHDDMMNITVIAESTPGPIAINCATYVGASQAGIPGALLATFAVVLPSFILILLLTALLYKVIENQYVQAVLRGMKPCIAGIILAVGGWMIVRNLFTGYFSGVDLRAAILTAVLAAAYFGLRKVRKKGLSPIALIAVAAVLGIAAYGVQ